MARYKPIDSSPRLLPVDLAAQLLPGTFEDALDQLIDHEFDLSGFDERYRNDDCGATAYGPAVLLKAIVFRYSRGLVSSRAIERACRENVTFIAPTRDAAPHFTIRRRIDSPAGRAHYGRRLAIVEPVFANLRHNKQLDRFTLRGRRTVDTQWKLYCLVHNIEKLARHVYS